MTSIGLFTRVVSFFYKIILSRMVGAESLGSYQIALSVFMTLTTVSSSGIPLALARKTASSLDENTRRSLLTSAVLLGEVVATSLFLAVLIFPSLRTAFAGESSGDLLLILAPAIFSSTTYSILRARFWGKGNFTAYSVTEAVEGVIRAVLGVTLISGAIGRGGIRGAVIAFVISDYVSAILLFVLFRRDSGKFGRPHHFKEILRSAAPLTMTRFFTELITSLTAVLIPKMLISSGVSASEALSDFGRASGMALPLLLAPSTLISPLSVVLVPEVASRSARREYACVKRKISTTLSLSAVVSCAFIALFLPLGKQIGTVVFNDARAGEFVSLASPLVLVMNLNGVSSSCLNSLGKERGTLKNYLLGAAVLIASIIFLTSDLKIYSMLVGLVSCFTLTSVLNLCILKKTTGLSSRFIRSVFISLICALSSAFLSHFSLKILPFGSLLSLLLSGAVGIFSYLALLLSTGVIDVSACVKILGIKKHRARSTV